uniref:Methyltransferase domain-containing protein n=1 Tax=Eutreptiella gymnastica TaxID=73025 RepID=A0A7S1J7R0_9EUGL
MHSALNMTAPECGCLHCKKKKLLLSDMTMNSSTFRAKRVAVRNTNLQAMSKVLDANGVRHCLIAGSLLGSVRNGSLLPHDWDDDLALFGEDRARMNEYVLRDLCAAGFTLCRLHKDGATFGRHGDIVDLEVWSLTDSGRVRRYAAGQVLPAFAWEPLQRMAPLSDGSHFWAPAYPKPILELMYGNWHTPSNTHYVGRTVPIDPYWCPPGPKETGIAGAQKAKYAMRGCEDQGLWQEYSIKHHYAIARLAASVLQLKNSKRVIDWGSGCGHTLSWWHKDHGAIGLGIEATESVAAWAQGHSAVRTCLADGNALHEWMPHNLFDVAFSWGGIYHARQEKMSNAEAVCDVVRVLALGLKPGGAMLFGYTKQSEFPQESWQTCLGTNFTVATLTHIQFLPPWLAKPYWALHHPYVTLVHASPMPAARQIFPFGKRDKSWFMVHPAIGSGWVRTVNESLWLVDSTDGQKSDLLITKLGTYKWVSDAKAPDAVLQLDLRNFGEEKAELLKGNGGLTYASGNGVALLHPLLICNTN